MRVDASCGDGKSEAPVGGSRRNGANAIMGSSIRSIPSSASERGCSVAPPSPSLQLSIERERLSFFFLCSSLSPPPPPPRRRWEVLVRGSGRRHPPPPLPPSTPAAVCAEGCNEGDEESEEGGGGKDDDDNDEVDVDTILPPPSPIDGDTAESKGGGDKNGTGTCVMAVVGGDGGGGVRNEFPAPEGSRSLDPADGVGGRAGWNANEPGGVDPGDRLHSRGRSGGVVVASSSFSSSSLPLFSPFSVASPCKENGRDVGISFRSNGGEDEDEEEEK